MEKKNKKNNSDSEFDIKSVILKFEYIDWQNMQFVQAEDFKVSEEEDYQRVQNSLLKNNFADTFNVWQDPEGVIWCLDGKRRHTILTRMIAEGKKIPQLLPAIFVDARDKQHAAELVLVYSSEFGTITPEGLKAHLETYGLDFREMQKTMSLPDFSVPKFEQRFGKLLTEDTEVEIQELEKINKNILVKTGDIFRLGNHKLMCGSCLVPENLEILMEGEKARILNTDPPYNLKTSFFSGNGDVNHKDFAMGAGEMTDDEFVSFIEQIMQGAKAHTCDGSIHYIFMDFRHSWHMGEASRKVYGSPVPKQMCVWVKDVAANGSFYRAQHELCFIYKNGEAKHISHIDLMDRFRSNIWQYAGANSWSNPDRERGEDNKIGIGELANHPTPKNSEMISDMILDSTNEGDLVLEMFSGSGTCIIAGEKTKRRVYATEIEPEYVQSTIIRYYKFCKKNNLECKFEHINGALTLNNFTNESETDIRN